MPASDDALLHLAGEVGELRGGIEGVHTLIEQAVVKRLDEYREGQADHERRIVVLETAKEAKAAESTGAARANARWAAAVSAGVTLIFNSAISLLRGHV